MKLFTFAARAVVVFVITMSTADAGKISGTVTYKGKARKPKSIQMSADAVCAAIHTTPAKDEKMIVGKGEGDIHSLANVFVYVKSGLKKQDYPVPDKPVVIDQKGCTYVPHVLGIRVGQELQFKNSDKTMHNVHSLSKKTSKQFNRGMPAGSPNAKYKLTKPEVMAKIKCDAHTWMTCYVGALEHPFFAVTGKDGKFSIDGLDDGEYEIEAWHEMEKKGLPRQVAKVTVTGGAATHDFEFVRIKKK